MHPKCISSDRYIGSRQASPKLIIPSPSDLRDYALFRDIFIHNDTGPLPTSALGLVFPIFTDASIVDPYPTQPRDASAAFSTSF